MKKIFFFLFCLMATGIHSQVVRSEFVFGSKQSHIDVQIKKDKLFTVGFINNISANIWRDFSVTFKDPTDIRWYVEGKEITGYFNCDSEKIIVCYKKDGYLISTRKAYPGDKLDPLIAGFLSREMEKSFVVYLVTEVNKDDNTIYEISLQDEKSWCFVQIFRNTEREILEIIDKRIIKKI